MNAPITSIGSEKRTGKSQHIIIGDLRYLVKKLGSQKAAAEQLKVSPQYLHDVLGGRRKVTERLAKKLGWRLVRTWIYEGRKA